MKFDAGRVEKAIREILEAIGEDPDRDGLANTPSRVARMYKEILGGVDADPCRHLTVTFEEGHDEMVLERGIPFASVCEHHLIPFIGQAHVAYIPSVDGRITGLSKLARVVDGFSRRPEAFSDALAHPQISPTRHGESQEIDGTRGRRDDAAHHGGERGALFRLEGPRHPHFQRRPQ